VTGSEADFFFPENESVNPRVSTLGRKSCSPLDGAEGNY
jgi:hypothetical protein